MFIKDIVKVLEPEQNEKKRKQTVKKDKLKKSNNEVDIGEVKSTTLCDEVGREVEEQWYVDEEKQ